MPQQMGDDQRKPWWPVAMVVVGLAGMAATISIPFPPGRVQRAPATDPVPPPPTGGAKNDPGLVPENLARGKPASASSSEGEDHAPSQGNDGEPRTRWCASGPQLGEWWQVDLGKPEDLTGCRLAWEFPDRDYRYKVEGSADGKTWKMLVDATEGKRETDRPDEHRFTATGIRFVRVTVTGLPEGSWASFWEFEVLGTRLVKPEKPARTAPNVANEIKAPDGFDVTLFAAPPEVSYPTCLAAAPDGTVFVGVDLNGSLGARPRQGKVVRCLDTDGDGKADRFNVFAEPESPRGLWFDNNTLYVLHPPFLTAYYDDDGDGVADRHEDLASGFGYELKVRGADHTTNGFRIGIDGWLYIAVGDYGAFDLRGKDGTRLRFRGGGVLRIRPDGSGLEVVADGLRNIYDVGVSPQLDLLTRDNTNDGGGWDVRLSHVVPTGHYGYPTLFAHFPGEILPPLLDTGGGSPTGTLFLDEPGFPPGFGTALYTCEWGRSHVDRHPLTPNGSTFKAGIEKFLDIPRPTDIDVDGSGRLYVSSWKDGGFDFSKPNVGYVVRVTPKGHRAAPFPDLKRATDEALLDHLASASQVCRLHAQREILRRGARSVFTEGLERLAAGERPMAARVAAVFTLNQLLGKDARAALLRLARLPAVRAFALKALADDRRNFAGLDAAPFVEALNDQDPRVRVQAVIGLNRLGKPDSAAHLLPLTADADPVVAHVAVNALVALRAADVCLKALDSADRTRTAGGLRVLQALHEPTVVSGLIDRLHATRDTVARRGLLRTLARLYHREGDWDGSWWGTRPDTTGPYFKPVAWSESPRIAAELRKALKEADKEGLRWLLPELHRNRADLPEATPRMLELARDDADFRRLAVALVAARPAPPEEAVALLAAVAAGRAEEPSLRARAVRALARLDRSERARDSLLGVLASEAKLPDELEHAWADFVRDGRRVGEVTTFVGLARDPQPGRRELALAVLATVADRNLGPKEARSAAESAVQQAWGDPSQAIPLVRAVARLNLGSYALQVRQLTGNANARVADAARQALGQLKVERAAANAGPPVAKLSFEAVVAAVQKDKGDAGLGAKLFNRTGCVNCHTVSAKEPLKGPLLAGISTRYKRPELVESILRPSAKIAQGFETFRFQLSSGKSLTGFVVRESGTEVEVRDGTGATAVLKKDDIEERQPGKISVMPEKLVDHLTAGELASILAYLESLKAN